MHTGGYLQHLRPIPHADYCTAAGVRGYYCDGTTGVSNPTSSDVFPTAHEVRTPSRQMRSAPEEIRTPNLLIRSQMLYPLSYGRVAARAVGEV
jgi:hypothetical protein